MSARMKNSAYEIVTGSTRQKFKNLKFSLIKIIARINIIHPIKYRTSHDSLVFVLKISDKFPPNKAKDKIIMSGRTNIKL